MCWNVINNTQEKIKWGSLNCLIKNTDTSLTTIFMEAVRLKIDKYENFTCGSLPHINLKQTTPAGIIPVSLVFCKISLWFQECLALNPITAALFAMW